MLGNWRNQPLMLSYSPMLEILDLRFTNYDLGIYTNASLQNLKSYI